MGTLLIAKPIETPQIYANDEQLAKLFGLYSRGKNKLRLVQDRRREMDGTPEFSNYVLETDGVPVARIDMFEEFLLWRKMHKYL
jgi:hypothetical protein